MGREEKLSDAKPPPRRSAADKLCDVATDLFYRRGIRAVGVDEIVTQTGVTKPTLYRSYASKDDLVAVCLLKKIEEGRESLNALSLRFAGDPLGELRAIVRHFAADVDSPDFRGCAVMNAAVEFPENDHPVREVAERSKAELCGRLAALTQRLSVADSGALADGLMLLIEGAAAIRHTSGSQGPSAALTKAADALLDAYLKR